jgi:hypothetical protein
MEKEKCKEEEEKDEKKGRYFCASWVFPTR